MENKNMRCPECRVKLRKHLTNRALLENIPVEELGRYPGCLDTIWTGEYLCPKCNRKIKEEK